MQNPKIEIAEVFEPLLEPARYKGAHGGRGSGKSTFFADLAIINMVSKDGFRIVCIREVQRTIADSVKRLLEDKIQHLGLDQFFTITDSEIRGINGSLCIFRGMQNHTAASIKSLEGFNVAWVEEAQTISQRSLDLLTPTIREKGSELWFGWNPENEDDPVDVFLRIEPPENAIIVEANWNDNPWFPEELRGDMERDRARDPEKYAHVWNGEYVGASEARIFRNFIEGELDPPENVVWFYGVDWGFSVDATAGLRCCIMGDVLYIDSEAYEVGVPMEGLPKLLQEVTDIHKWPSTADNARPETIDYCRRHGLRRMRAAKKGKGSIEDGITFIQGFDVVINPRCPNVLNEFKKYAYKTDKRTSEILPVVEDKHNHLIDALRYAVEGCHRKGKLINEAVRPTEQKRRYRSNNDEGSNWKTA